MADSLKARFDASELEAGFDRLLGPFRESLARRMLVTAGTEIRDEAKRWVPREEGVLQDSIYLAYRDRESRNGVFKYSVTWNHKRAPHGHLIEFGHWMPYKVIYNAKLGRFQTLATGSGRNVKGVPRPGGPKWVAAKPFLRPAYEIAGERALQAAIQRGRDEFPILMRESGGV